MSKEEDVIEALALLGIMVNALEQEIESIKKDVKVELTTQRPRLLASESGRRFRLLIQELKFKEE